MLSTGGLPESVWLTPVVTPPTIWPIVWAVVVCVGSVYRVSAIGPVGAVAPAAPPTAAPRPGGTTISASS